jgi:RNA polymerase sigma-70 factor (ECF subfamily)
MGCASRRPTNFSAPTVPDVSTVPTAIDRAMWLSETDFEPLVPEATAASPSFAAGELYRRLAPAVLGYLRAQGAADPEDLMGEVFLHVVRDLGRFRGNDAAVRAWVFRIARNRLIDDQRRRRRRPLVLRAVVPEHPDGRAAAESPGLDPALLAALGDLTPEQRQVVTLRFVADLPIRDVARILHRRPGAVKALQNRAMARLAGALAVDGRQGGAATGA